MEMPTSSSGSPRDGAVIHSGAGFLVTQLPESHPSLLCGTRINSLVHPARLSQNFFSGPIRGGLSEEHRCLLAST